MSDPTPNTGASGPAPTPAAAPKAPVTAASPPAPKPPPKPAARPAKGKDRRFWLVAIVATPFAAAWTAMAASLTLMFLGTLRFLFPNVLSEPPSRIKVGFPDGYEEGKVVDRFKDQNFWIVRYEGKIIALSTTCTHLGCTPNYLEREGKFKCPCHGSGFFGPPMGNPGINFEGPAPRPLERWAISIGDDGQLVVDKSMKFQKELGQWDYPESFIKVV